MSADAGFGYVQVRLQAALSRLPAETDWERLAATRSLSSFLEEARAGVLANWVRGLSAQSQARDLERATRALALEEVARFAAWAPPPWRAAVAWVAWVPWLPLIEHLSRGHSLPAWLGNDETPAWTRARPEGLVLSATDDAGWRELLARAESGTLGEGWLAGWKARWPAVGRETRARLDALSRLIARHLAAFRAATPESAWETRRALRDALRVSLHCHPLQPTAVFSYLGLVFLDLERLRGALLRRSLYGLQASD